MKKITYLLWSLLLSFVVTSCSDDEETAVVAPIFPESQTFDIRPDEVCEISFEANQVWKLTTDKQWLKFVDETGRYQSLTGKAGAQTVKVTVTDGALGFEGDKALVQLTMAGETQTIAELNRPAKERVVRMYTANSTTPVEIDEFEDVTIGRAENIGFEANFDWKVDVETLPEWLISEGSEYNKIENLCGEAGQKITFARMASVDVDKTRRYTDLAGSITIRAIEDDYTYSFPISAPGIEEGKIQWIGNVPTLRAGLIWDDKGNHLLKDGASGDLSTTEAPAQCQALIRDNKFTCHFVEWDSQTKTAVEIPSDKVWVEVVEQEGNLLTLKPKNNMERAVRTAVLFLVPEGVDVDYNSYFSSYNGQFNFNPAGFGILLTQYGLFGGFEVYRQINSMKFEQWDNVIQPANVAEIVEKLGLVKADNIYERTFTAEEWDLASRIHIVPLGLIQKWGSYELFNSRFESMGDEPAGWSIEKLGRGNVYDDNYGRSMSLLVDKRVPFAEITDTCLYIVLRDAAGQDIGTFVIRK